MLKDKIVKTLNINSLEKLDSVVKKISDFIGLSATMSSSEHCYVVYFTGNLGVGKTTFVQHWLRYLGVQGVIPSPTYTIMNEYESNGHHFIHADLYRLGDAEELMYLDVREWRDRASLILIEWPERGKDFLPSADMYCHLAFEDDVRVLVWETKR